MILKAKERGNGAQLARYLLTLHENEHVELYHMRGFISDDLNGALKEADAIAKGTRCTNHLFSMSLNPPNEALVSDHLFESAADRIEERLGLEGQQRAIVFHDKNGQRHAHVVWSRIDAETMTAKKMSHYKTRLKSVSREVFIEHGWKMPRGLMDSKERDPRNFNLEEWHQAKTDRQNVKEVKSVIQDCWAISDNKASFEQALESRGLYLAKGDRRGHVAMRYDGEVFSIPRATGKKAKEVTARLGDPKDLRSIEDTESHIAKQVAPKLRDQLRYANREKQHKLAPLDQKRLKQRDQQRLERDWLTAQQQSRQAIETRQRAERLRKGFRGVWDRLTGRHARIQKQNILEAEQAKLRDVKERQDQLHKHQHATRKTLQEMQRVRDDHRVKTQGLFKELQRFENIRRRADRHTEPTQAQSKHPQPKPEPQKHPTAPSKLSSLKTREERLKAYKALRQKDRSSDRDRGPDLER